MAAPAPSPRHSNDEARQSAGFARHRRAHRVLVTGGSGFIGSHLVAMLLERGDTITVVDNLSTGRRQNLAPHERLRFIEADLGDALGSLGKGEQFDRIYHLAAAVGVKLIVDKPIECIQTNVEQTLNLLRFALTHGPDNAPAHTFIASSSEVYGKAEKQPFSEEDDVVYGPTTRSRWSYACSKAIDEYLALAFHTHNKLPVVVGRFFNTVGPRQVGSYGMVLPNFVAAAMKNEPITVYGDGEQSRCFCDVRDVVQALPTLLDTPTCYGRVFNIGSDQPISMNNLARQVINVLGSRSILRHVSYDAAYAAGFEDLRRRQPDLSRVRAAIGFAPSIPLEQTIRDLATWMADDQSRAATRTQTD